MILAYVFTTLSSFFSSISFPVYFTLVPRTNDLTSLNSVSYNLTSFVKELKYTSSLFEMAPLAKLITKPIPFINIKIDNMRYQNEMLEQKNKETVENKPRVPFAFLSGLSVFLQ